MEFKTILWYLAAGTLLIAISSFGMVLKRVWLSSSIIYLLIGVLIGPYFLGLLTPDLYDEQHLTILLHLSEAAVVISLFATGLKMRLPPRDARWLPPIILATAAMVVTIALVGTAGWLLMGLPLGMAVLLGAVLAPTDPVLASEVQVSSPDDRDRLRLTLTGEAGLNDGTAFPFVLLGVGLVSQSLHPLGTGGWKWLTIDLLWMICGGLALGWFAGCLIARSIIALRRRLHGEAGSDEMLTLGMIALVYGLALLVHAYAFLAVFAAAVAIRRTEHRETNSDEAGEAERAAVIAEHEAEADEARKHREKGDSDPDPIGRTTAHESPEHVPALLAREQTHFAEGLERIVTVLMVVLIGSLLSLDRFKGPTVWWFVPLMLLVIRPVAVWSTLRGHRITPRQRVMTMWFGMRGVGTIYYLTYALQLGVLEEWPDESRRVADICIATICASVVLHGLSVTPLMNWYRKLPEAEASPT